TPPPFSVVFTHHRVRSWKQSRARAMAWTNRRYRFGSSTRSNRWGSSVVMSTSSMSGLIPLVQSVFPTGFPGQGQSNPTPGERAIREREKRAGEGNRTLVTSLEGWSSTTELHPRELNVATYPRAHPVSAGRRIHRPTALRKPALCRARSGRSFRPADAGNRERDRILGDDLRHGGRGRSLRDAHLHSGSRASLRRSPHPGNGLRHGVGGEGEEPCHASTLGRRIRGRRRSGRGLCPDGTAPAAVRSG